jgi:hypothetical protein
MGANTAVSFTAASSEDMQVPLSDGAAFRPNGAANYSVEYWFKLASGGTASLGHAADDSGLVNFYVQTLETGIQTYIDKSGGGSYCTMNYFPGGNIVSTGVFHHVVVTTTAAGGETLSDAREYLDGVEVGSCTSFSGAMTANTGSHILFEVSRRNGPTFNTAIIDEVAIYPSALSAGQVLAHYNLGLTP